MIGDVLRVLFLDIDGVLNSSAFFAQISGQEEQQTTAEEEGIIRRVLPYVDLPPGAKNEMSICIDLRHLDPQAIIWLNKATTLPDVRVVVSSTWRHGYTVKGLQLLLESRGFKGQVIGKTQELWGRVRGDEIHQWLEDHQAELALQGYTCPPLPGSVEAVAILDDDSDMGRWMPRLVKTNNKVGVQPADIERVIEMLHDLIG